MSFKKKRNRKVTINFSYFYTGTDLRYIPLANSIIEQSGTTSLDSQFMAANKGRLLSLSFKSSGTPGSSVFIIRDNELGSTIGTKTVTLTGGGAIDVIDFTTGLDSGTEFFSSSTRVLIGITPTASAASVTGQAIFEIDS